MTFRYKKSLGQHFLKDPNTQRKIASLIDDYQPVDRLLEIGPGMGAITQHLLVTGVPLTVVDVDTRIINHWQKQNAPHLTVIQSNILDLDLTAVFESDSVNVIIGNLPYYITTPILFHLEAMRASFSAAIVMMQRDVAERILAPPGNKTYGILSVLIPFFFTVRKAFHVPPTVFDPPPKVESTVLIMEPRNTMPDVDPEQFRIVVRSAFNFRRKMLRSSLKAMIPDSFDSPIDLTRRPETLNEAEFVELTRSFAVESRNF